MDSSNPAQDLSREQWDVQKEYLDGLKSSHMVKFISNYQTDLKRIKTENEVFEGFLLKNEPSLISGLAKTMEAVSQIQGKFVSTTTLKTVQYSSDQKLDTQSVTDESLSKKTDSKKGPRINYSLKTDLASRDVDQINEDMDKFKIYAHKLKNRLRAEIEEYTIRDDEIKEATRNFEQQIVIEAVEDLTQKIPAEKFVRYMQEWLKYAQLMLERLRFRTTNLRTQLKKLRGLLIQKEEIGEAINEVDFDVLGISNKNFIQAIEDKNNNMLELKKIDGEANLKLTTQKNFLARQDTYLKTMENKLKSIEKEFGSLNVQYEQTIAELDVHQRKYNSLKMMMKKYKVPDVMEYISKKNELTEVKKKLKTWNRKTHIQTIVMHTYCNMMLHLTNSNKVNSEWYTKKNEYVDEELMLPDDLNLLTRPRRMSISKSKMRRFSMP